MNNKDYIHSRYFNIIFFVFICVSIILFAEPTKDVFNQTNKTVESEEKKITIIVDPGHGGRDPGKVGVNGALEKDINLCIALKLKQFLELNDINVIMTREEDIGLYSESDSNRKAADMRKRVEIIKNSDAVVAISIHQNSFPQEDQKGAQVFYYKSSDTSKEYAEIMQAQIKKTLKDGNRRKAKSNDNYYMLKKTDCPIVIVECGYLTNNEEAALLIDEKYQEKMAWAIHLGLISYINKYIEP